MTLMTESPLSSDCLILGFTRHDDQIENIDNFLAVSFRPDFWQDITTSYYLDKIIRKI